MNDPSAQLELYLAQPINDLLVELAGYEEQADGGALRGTSTDPWQPLVPVLQQRLCVEWNWCQRRQDARFDDPMNLAVLIVSIIAGQALAWQIPAALIAAILVKRGMDTFCHCPPPGA